MHTIHLRANGDEWINQEQVNQQLLAVFDPDCWVCFDTGAEGISLKYSGIADFIEQWADKTGHSREKILINSPNVVEQLPYQNLCNSKANHFFPMSGHYQTEVPAVDSNSKLFGFFVGRHTTQRNNIAVDIVQNYKEHFLISIMKSRFVPSPWSSLLHEVGSLDNKFVHDQYTGQVDTNQSLLQFYNQFQIELVAETMCHGQTFFPTEKTLRPIVGRRPMLVFGPVDFLSNLRKLGFQTYNSCWDESYDSLEGSARWQAMTQVIDSIIANGYDLSSTQVIAEHNSQHLKQWHKHTRPKNIPRVINDS